MKVQILCFAFLVYFGVGKISYAPKAAFILSNYSKTVILYNINHFFLKFMFNNAMYFCDAALYFQHHYSSLQCHMIFRNHSNMLICCSWNISYYKLKKIEHKHLKSCISCSFQDLLFFFLFQNNVKSKWCFGFTGVNKVASERYVSHTCTLNSVWVISLLWVRQWHDFTNVSTSSVQRRKTERSEATCFPPSQKHYNIMHTQTDICKIWVL